MIMISMTESAVMEGLRVLRRKVKVGHVNPPKNPGIDSKKRNTMHFT